jgi:predicted phosphodiesterase
MDILSRLSRNEQRIQVQVMSDLHLEVRQQYATFEIPAQAPYLILAGDIGRLKDYESYLGFLEKQAQQFVQICLVLGNHEFYGVSRQEGLSLAKSLENEPCLLGKVSVLNRRVVEVSPKVIILGCTLHSHIPTESQEVVQRKVNDFKRITGWTVDEHNLEHDEDLQWLQSQVEVVGKNRTSSDRSTILVVTHHAPCKKGTSDPRLENNDINSAFATEVIEENFWGVQCWLFGHTHYNTDTTRNGMRLVSNQRGYVFPSQPSDRQDPTLKSQPMFLSRLKSIFASSGTSSEVIFDVGKVIKL